MSAVIVVLIVLAICVVVVLRRVKTTGPKCYYINDGRNFDLPSERKAAISAAGFFFFRSYEFRRFKTVGGQKNIVLVNDRGEEVSLVYDPAIFVC